MLSFAADMGPHADLVEEIAEDWLARREIDPVRASADAAWALGMLVQDVALETDDAARRRGAALASKVRRELRAMRPFWERKGDKDALAKVDEVLQELDDVLQETA